MEKNVKKDVCICITESLCCTAEINTANYHAKWSKSDRERQISYDITYI